MTSLEVFQYNISFPWNSFYKRQFSLQLLADAIVSSNMKAAVKLQTSVQISLHEDIYRLFSMKDNAWTLLLLYCHLFSFLLLLCYETKYHSSHIEVRIMNALFKVNLHKNPGKIS